MKATNTNSHRKAEAMLRKFNFTPYRQFEPKTADTIGKGELFELWKSPNNKFVFVQFYGGDLGFEVYIPATASNLIFETEKALSAL